MMSRLLLVDDDGSAGFAGLPDSAFFPAVVLQPFATRAQIAAADAEAADSGSELVFAPGTYVGSTTVNLTAAVVRGYGATIAASGSTSPLAIGADGVKVFGLTADASPGTASAAISIASRTSVVLTDVTATGGQDFGIYGTGVDDLELVRCLATSNGTGGGSDAGFALHGSRITATSCRAVDNDGNGWRLFGTVENPGTQHTYVSCRARGNTLSGFYSTSSGANPVGVAFIGCKAQQNGSAGEYSGFNLGYLSEVTYEACVSDDNTEHGFVVMDADHVDLVAPRASGNGKAGIRLQADFARTEDANSGARYTTITAPRLVGNAAVNVPQLSIEGACHDIKITDGTVIDSPAGTGIGILTHEGYTDSYNVVVNGNTIDGNAAGNTVTSNVSTDKRVWGTNVVNGTPEPIYYTQTDLMRRNGGELTMLVVDAKDDLDPASGEIMWGYFVAERTEQIQNVRMFTGATGASDVTLARMGVYEVGPTGDITQVGRTSNEATMFAAADTGYTKALLSPFTKQRGQLYAVCVIVVADTPPTFKGRLVPAGFATEITSIPRLASRQLAKSDLPGGTVAVGQLVSSTRVPWMALLP